MASSLDNTNWYLAQVKPNSFRLAERNLARQGFDTFAPLIDEGKRSQGRFVTRQTLLFPGYLFVSFDPAVAGWRAVNSTYGVNRIVSTGHTPSAVPGEVVDGLRSRCGADGVLEPLDDLVQGSEVRITTGPFAEFVARVDHMTPDQRVWVLIDMMGRTTRVAVPRDGLIPI